MNLTDWRQEYNKYKLEESSLLDNPFHQFQRWFDQAVLDQNPEPNAMTLSTCIDNIPNSRIVLLKEMEQNQFIFYSNYFSKKGIEMERNNHVALLFYWPSSQRQVRISGTIHKTSREKSEAYFATRPLDSQWAAIASPQSKSISLEQLISNMNALKDQETPKCPVHWGGYAVAPSIFEFWQGQPARMHDRIVYELEEKTWIKKRLAP